MKEVSILAGYFMLIVVLGGCQNAGQKSDHTSSDAPLETQVLRVSYESDQEVIQVMNDRDKPLLEHHVRSDFRPYIHPLVAPDGEGFLTEYSPGHHKHQTGLYWGFTRVNGRDFFHNPEGSYWSKGSSVLLIPEGEEVKWRTEYFMLGESKDTLLKETQTWTMQLRDEDYRLDLEWMGEAFTDVTIGEYDYGGLFLRMPWKEGIEGRVINAARQVNEKAEGQRAMWVDVGMKVEGRSDMAHVALFDHPDNDGFPQMWRVDDQLGVGPASSRLGDWNIEEGSVKVIKHGLYVYCRELTDVDITEVWEDYSGREGTYSTADLWGIAQKEGREAKFLTPEEAVEHMTIEEGYQVNVWASEPMMTQPMAFCWDDRGRLWIAENRDYESRGHGFSNFGDSRILILEDTDRDGRADKKQVFAEGIPFPAALAVGFDGVFVGAPPNLLFVPDRNKDDRADMEDIEIRLTGWGIRDRHETLNSFHWGPDGWLYGCQGFATSSVVRKPAGKGKLLKHNDPFPEDLLEADGVEINGGVWRYHPTRGDFEVVAHGFSNPWGIDYDARGQLFMTACVIPHLWHVIPGGIYHRQGGSHFNPYVYQDIKTIADHSHRSAHGGARVYLSDAFPENQHGRLFMANIHEHAVLSDVLRPSGSGFTGEHGDDFLLANNAQWVGFSMELGPDGALYVLDWHDADICGKEVLNKETGRIFRIYPEKSSAEEWKGRHDDLNLLDDAALVELQKSKSSWHARRARLILQKRAYDGSMQSGTPDLLNDLLAKNNNTDIRLRGLWSLHITESISSADLVSLLNDDDQHIRSWAIQMLCESRNPSAVAQSRFVKMAGDDPSAVVRLYLAAAIQRMDPEAGWLVAGNLIGRTDDIDDHNIPKMIWFGLESFVTSDPSRAITLATNSRIPLISEFITRRLTDAQSYSPVLTAVASPGPSQLSMLKGMRDALNSSQEVEAPAEWPLVYAVLEDQGGEVAALALEIGQILGDQEAARQYLATLADPASEIDQKRTALIGLAKQQNSDLVPLLPDMLDDEDIRIDVIRSYAGYDIERLGRLLLDRYDEFTVEEQQMAIQTLSSRPGYGWMLTEALKNESILKRDVPAYVARQLRRVVGSGFVEVWGPIDEASSDIEASYAKYRNLLTPEKLVNGDAGNGRMLFTRTCAPCHKMYGDGGTIGPEITGSNRRNVEYLLSNVLEPSSEMQDDYRMVVITTRDGRTYSGNIAAENEREISLRIVGQDDVIISLSDIQSRENTPISMMPAGLLNTLTDQEVLDLVKYLQSDEQVEL